jgi:hypothetical protein
MSSYNGNINLKRFGEQVEWTEESLLEYKKCSEDPLYFIRAYCKIIHVDHGLIPFDLYDYQERMIGSMYEHRNTVTLSCRQSGKCHCINTTVTVRNKRTGKIETIAVGDLYERIETSAD